MFLMEVTDSSIVLVAQTESNYYRPVRAVVVADHKPNLLESENELKHASFSGFCANSLCV